MAAHGTDQNRPGPIPTQRHATRRDASADGRVEGNDPVSSASPDVDPQDDALAVWAELLRLSEEGQQHREQRALTHELAPPELLALAGERDRIALDLGNIPAAVDEDAAADPARAAETAAAPIRELRGLLVTLQSRLIIAQAEGLLIARYSMSVDSAFRVLVRLSQEANVPLRDVAARLVAAAEGRHP